MIFINQKQIKTEELSNLYPSNDVSASTLNILTSSKQIYHYDTLEQLQFELLLRKEIVSAANKLNRSGLKFKVFRKSICNADYWDRTRDGGFSVKKNVSSSDAIHDIFNHGSKYGTECATAILIVYFGALANIFSKDSYDRIFSDITLMNWHKIHSQLDEVGSVTNATDFLPGDRRYFKNPDVDPLTPEFQGENVIDMGSGSYYGHPFGVAKEKRIIDALNKLRKKGAVKPAYLMNSVGRPNFKNLSKLYYDNLS